MIKFKYCGTHIKDEQLALCYKIRKAMLIVTIICPFILIILITLSVGISKLFLPITILSTKERIIKKFPALIFLLIFFCFLVYLVGAKTFIQGFIYSFIIWTSIKLFVVFIIDILWYSNSPKYWIKGTEDLEKHYKNYKFYINSIPRSLIAGFIVSLIIGVIICVFH